MPYLREIKLRLGKPGEQRESKPISVGVMRKEMDSTLTEALGMEMTRLKTDPETENQVLTVEKKGPISTQATPLLRKHLSMMM